MRAGAGRGEVDPRVDHLHVCTHDDVDVGHRLTGRPIGRVDDPGGLVFVRRTLAEVDGGDHVGSARLHYPFELAGGVRVQIGQPVRRTDLGGLARPQPGRKARRAVGCAQICSSDEVAAAVGVAIEDSYVVKKIDLDYFEEA